MKKLILFAVLFALLGCGGGEFSARGPDEDAGLHDVKQEKPKSDVNQPDHVEAASVESSDGDGGADSPFEADASVPDADAAEYEADAPAEDGAKEADASGPTGPCGPIPQIGWWICYANKDLPPDSGVLHIALAGAIVKPGQDIVYEWKNPFVGELGKCIAPLPTDDSLLCPLGSLEDDTTVTFAPGWSHNVTDSLAKYACGDTCPGRAVIYHKGKAVGALEQEGVVPILKYVPHYQPPARNDLEFKSPSAPDAALGE